jgi:hypothetical protein
MALFDSQTIKEPFLTAYQLFHLSLALIRTDADIDRAPTDLAMRVRRAMADHNLALPLPLLFADTNWEMPCFGFLLNPVTDKLDLGAPTRWVLPALP